MVFIHDTEMSLRAAAALVNTLPDTDTEGVDRLVSQQDFDAYLDEYAYTGTFHRDDDELAAVRANRPRLLELWSVDRDGAVPLVNIRRAYAQNLPNPADVLAKTKDDFAADFKDLFPAVKALNDYSYYFIKDLSFLPTFPFHYKYLRQAVRGDYLNVFVTFDLTLRRLGESIFTTSRGLDPNMRHMDEIVNPPDWLIGEQANLSGQAADPFKIPPGTASGQEAPK